MLGDVLPDHDSWPGACRQRRSGSDASALDQAETVIVNRDDAASRRIGSSRSLVLPVPGGAILYRVR